MASTPSSLRLSEPLRERIRERARVERRSFANQTRVLLERGLVASADEPASLLDDAEVERLASVAREAIGGSQ